MSNKLDYDKPIFCLITGASRGIGRTIATETARRAKNQLILVLLARSEKNLDETKNLVLAVNKNVTVHCVATDLSKPSTEEYEKMLKSPLTEVNDSFSAVIFHNAADIGRIEKQIELADVKIWQDYYTFNLFSVTALNSVFVKIVKELTQNITIVNVSAVMGVKPYPYFSMYGSAKAARNLYFKVLAVEENYCRILTWFPGVVKSDMSDEVREKFGLIPKSGDGQTNPLKLITAEESVNTMYKVLEENKFESGDILDYYDVV